MPDDQWYFAKAGQQLGPVTLAAIQGMARSGELHARDLVWTEGMANWQPAGGLSQVFPQQTAPAGPAEYQSFPPAGNPAPPPAGPIPMGYYSPTYAGYPIRYSGFWLRFCAWLIDAILLWIVGFVIGLLINAAFQIPLNATAPSPNASRLILMSAIGNNIISIVIGWLYEAMMTSSAHQATLGKLAIGIKVTDERGQRISFARATGRHFAKILSGIILGIGYFIAAFTEKKQALHDIMAGTLVVQK